MTQYKQQLETQAYLAANLPANYTVHYAHSLSSTQTYLKDLIKTEAKLRARCTENHYLVATADFQTQGQGQRQRHWQSQAGQNVLLTLATKLPKQALSLFKQLNINIKLGLACLELTRELLLQAQASPLPSIALKWPNDLITIQPLAKLAGSLTEVLYFAGEAYLLFGFGLNLNQTEFTNLPTKTNNSGSQLPATSLRLQTNHLALANGLNLANGLDLVNSLDLANSLAFDLNKCRIHICLKLAAAIREYFNLIELDKNNREQQIARWVAAYNAANYLSNKLVTMCNLTIDPYKATDPYKAIDPHQETDPHKVLAPKTAKFLQVDALGQAQLGQGEAWQTTSWHTYEQTKIQLIQT